MWLIAGLGNSGDKYTMHRHNIGFRAVETIHSSENFPNWDTKLRSKISKSKMNGYDVILMKPEGYMNDSGRSLLEVSKFFKISVENIIVLHDELDIDAGKVKTKVGGGAAGHNGLRSIDSHIGKDYRRVRIGIHHPGESSRVTSHVLGDFHKQDEEWIESLLSSIASNISLLLSGKDDETAGAEFIRSLN